MSVLAASVFRDGDRLFNLTNKRSLPADADQAALAAAHCLAGQERQAVDDVLLRPPQRLALTVIPTWECNLRCRHCFVLPKLRRPGTEEARHDPAALADLVRRFCVLHPDAPVNVAFVGGEVSLRAAEMTAVAVAIRAAAGERPCRFTLTTNGVVLDDAFLGLLEHMDSIAISLDGDPEAHQEQRRAVDGTGDLWRRTLSNLWRMSKAGHRDKLWVQAALPDRHYRREVVLRWATALLKAGVRPARMRFGCVTPTLHDPVAGAAYAQSCRTHCRTGPCCKWRFLEELAVDPDGTVYADYFGPAGASRLGTVADSWERLAEAHRAVTATMPILHDPKCQACPVVGLCWGRCAADRVTARPSDGCNQERLLARTTELAAAGGLTEALRADRFWP